MADAIVRLKVESQEYDSKIKSATAGMEHLERTVRKMSASFEVAEKEDLEFVRSLGQMETKAYGAKGKLKELSTAFTDLTAQYNRLTSREKAAPFGKAMSASIQQLKGRIRELNTSIASAEKQMAGGLGGQFAQGLSSAFASFGPAMMTMTAVMGTINGLKKVIGDTVQTNMKFEQSTAVLASVMGKTRDEIGGLISQAKQLGATTQYTAIQITELQTNLARLGFSETEIMNSTRGVQALATATGADLGEAANLAGAALRAFGMESSEMERVVSVLAVSTTKSALSFEKLATAVPIVAPVAKQFGFTIEDVVTMLGKLSDAGFDASMAATATRNIFLNMADSSGKLAQALGRPIRSIEDMAPAMAELRDRGIDLAEMLELTDKRSVAAFATFLDQADTMVKFKESITGCSEALQGMVDEQLNTLQGSVTIMKSAWEGLMLTFSESNGTIKSVVDSLTELLTAWTNWRNRRQGGDAAITTFELGGDADAAAAYIEEQRGKGVTDEGIIAQAEADKAAIDEELASAEALYKQLEEIQQLKGREHDDAQNKWNSDFRAMFPEYNVGQHGQSPAYMMRQIAGMRDQSATMGMVVSNLTPASVGQVAGGGKGGALSAEDIVPKGLIAQLKARISELNKELDNAVDPNIIDQIQTRIKRTQAELNELTNSPLANHQMQAIPLDIELDDSSVEGLEAEVNALREKLGMQPIQLGITTGKGGGVVDTAKQTEKAWGAAANAVQAIGGALQQIEDPSAKVAGIIMEAVANIALGFAMASTQAAKAGPIAWIAATVSGLATMFSTIASIKSVTKGGFANGGIVPGNSFSGDNLHTSDYGINSGELILNRAQQNTIASQLQGGASKIRVEGFVRGHDILLAGSNYALSTGKAGAYLPIIAG